MEIKIEKHKACFFYGATGQTKVINEFLGQLGYELRWLFDDDPEIPNLVENVPVIGGWDKFLSWKDQWEHPEKIGFLVTVGGVKGKVRFELQKKISNFSFKPLTVIHPTAFVARNAKVGAGSQILARAVVSAHVRIGDACIVNTAAQVDHECEIEDGVHLMPGAILTGEVKVKKYASVGAGAVILPKITIGKEAVVGAGAVVTKNVDPGAVVVGVPARPRKE